MLKRKFTPKIEEFLVAQTNKILLINGARQIGKSYIIRYVGKRLFKHFIEINLKEDFDGDRNGVTYLPIYFIMFLNNNTPQNITLPEL